MKKIFRIVLAAGFVLLGLKLLLPYHLYPIEHFEYLLLKLFPVSWKAIAIISRILVGFLFVAAFVLLFYWQKTKWTKFIAPFMVSIPFIVNAVFPENFKDQPEIINKDLNFELASTQDKTVLLAYFSPNCIHCKEAAFKLNAAKQKEKTFPEIRVISNNKKLELFFRENNLNFEIDSITTQQFLQATNGSFPKFEIVESGQVKLRYQPENFNYAVLDNLSKQ